MHAKIKFFFLLLTLVIHANYLFAQSSAYVGETFYLNAPSVPGTIDGASWYIDEENKKNSVYLSGNHHSCFVRVDTYFTGTVTIVCKYGYSYYIGSKKYHDIGTAYHYLSCKKSKVTLDKSSLSLNIGESVDLTYTNSSGYDLPVNAWSTSDEKIATINDKENVYEEKTVTITAVGEGECTITFNGHTGEESPTCSVIVKSIPPKGIILTPETLIVKEGNSGSFSYKLSPEDAYSKIKWTSSNESIAKVSYSGIITAISAGTTKITAETSNGLSACGTVEVTPLPQQIALNGQNEIALGYTIQLTPTLTPINATSTYTWETSDPNVITVDADGKVRGRKLGTATITVTTENGKKASSRITVKNPSDGMEYRNAEVRVKTIKDLIKTSINKFK